MFCFDHPEIINQFNTTLYLGLFKQKKKKKNPTANQFDLKSGKKKITSPSIKYVVKCKP